VDGGKREQRRNRHVIPVDAPVGNDQHAITRAHPVFCLGAEKTPKEIDALNLAYKAVKAGARGVVFGRNVIQAANPAAFLQGLKAVVKDEADPEAVAREYRLV
jgi:hypothetical protein